MSRRRGSLTLIAVALAPALAATPSSARPYLPAGNHIFAGLTGGSSIIHHERMVGKHPAVFEDYLTYDTPSWWLAVRDPSFRARLGLELSTSKGYDEPALNSPEGIARGGADGFLVNLNHNLARSGRIVYVRIMGEPNGWWNAYSAFTAAGALRGARNSPRWYVQAWRRTVLILRGGSVRGIDRRLRALGMPGIRVRALSYLRVIDGVRRRLRIGRLPHSRVAFLWVPQDAGSPDIAANSPAAYWPGSAYVDWVGTDFYSSYPNFSLLDRFYGRFTGKPFVISEWAVDGADDPRFVRTLFAWVLSHPRVRMINYFQGYGRVNPYDLSRYPAARAVLRRELRKKRFLAYPPEYAQPPKHRRKPPPERPPLAPSPGPPPSPPPPSPPQPICLPLVNVCLPGL